MDTKTLSAYEKHKPALGKEQFVLINEYDLKKILYLYIIY